MLTPGLADDHLDPPILWLWLFVRRWYQRLPLASPDSSYKTRLESIVHQHVPYSFGSHLGQTVIISH
jgi:hypothetical protein